MHQDLRDQISDYRDKLPDELPEGYFLDDFETLLRFVNATYPHLLSVDEQSLIDDFFVLTIDAKKLFVRLSNRKGPLFRLDRLSYPELNLAEAVDELVSCRFVQRLVPPIEEAVQICNKAELLSVCEGEPASLKKAELAELCLAKALNPALIIQLDVIEVLRQLELLVIKLLFFGNFHQNMTDFVLGELIAPYEKYEISGDACPFTSRETVDRLVYLKQLSDVSYDAVEVDETGDLLFELAGYLGERPTDHVLRRRWDKTLLRLARQLERLDRPGEALDLYQRTEATPSRERQVRLHAKSGADKESLVLCDEMVDRPYDDEEREFALQFGARLAKKSAHNWQHPSPRALADIPQRTITIEQIESSVEMNAATYFADQGYDAWYVENSLFRSLFGLAFWDVIFAPVPGAFFNPFQRAPQDIYTADFFSNRQALIELRMREIANGQLKSIVLGHYREKLGLANQFVNWRYLDAGLLESALESIPAAHCAAVFQRLVQDVKDNGSGFPDLVLFTGDEYRLVEIKGPGDKLQKNQIRWFHYFQDHGIAAEVVNVEYQ